MKESKFYYFFSKISSIILLNTIFVITSLPLITIGTSLHALYYVMFKLVKDEEGYVIRDYLKSWKSNIKQATVVWLIIIAGFIFAFFDFRISKILPERVSTIYIAIVLFALLVLLIFELFVFPVMARYKLPTRKLIKTSFLIAFVKPGYTLLIVLSAALLVFVSCYNAEYILKSLSIWLSFGFSTVSYIYSIIFLHIFNQVDCNNGKNETCDND